MAIIEVCINKDFSEYKKGQKINIDVDKNGIPLVRFWRNRFKDASIDKCISFEKTKKQIKSKGNNNAIKLT